MCTIIGDVGHEISIEDAIANAFLKNMLRAEGKAIAVEEDDKVSLARTSAKGMI
jgi:hypothetical protein